MPRFTWLSQIFFSTFFIFELIFTMKMNASESHKEIEKEEDEERKTTRTVKVKYQNLIHLSF